MTKFARLDGANTVIETFDHPTLLPGATHIPDIARQFVPCPDSVVPGAVLAGAKWTNPAPAAVAVVLPQLTPMVFYMAFTPAERIAIKTSTDAEVREFWETYQLAAQLDHPIDPNLVSVKSGLAYLVSLGILGAVSRVPDILAGVPQ